MAARLRSCSAEWDGDASRSSRCLCPAVWLPRHHHPLAAGTELSHIPRAS